MTTVTWNSPAAGTLADVNGGAYYEFKSNVTVTDTEDFTVYSIVSGTIPEGTDIGILTGKIKGYPANIANSYTFTIRATNNSVYEDRTFTQNVLFNPTIVTWDSPDEGTLPIVYEGEPYSFIPLISVANSVGSTTFSWTDGNIPSGANYNFNTGVISGTLNHTGGAIYTFTLRAINNGAYADRTFTQNTLPTGYTWNSPISEDQGGFAGGSYYSMVPIISTIPSGQTLFWSIESGTLPDGTNLNNTTGIVSGTLTNINSTYSYTIKTAILGNIVRKTFSGTIVMV